jgi:hypothetical protein
MPDGDLKLVSDQLKAERRTVSLLDAKGGAEPKKMERKMVRMPDLKAAVEPYQGYQTGGEGVQCNERGGSL